MLPLTASLRFACGWKNCGYSQVAVIVSIPAAATSLPDSLLPERPRRGEGVGLISQPYHDSAGTDGTGDAGDGDGYLARELRAPLPADGAPVRRSRNAALPGPRGLSRSGV